MAVEKKIEWCSCAVARDLPSCGVLFRVDKRARFDQRVALPTARLSARPSAESVGGGLVWRLKKVEFLTTV